MSTPRVHTYHCTFCSHLVLASTHTLSSVPRRRDPGLDHAYIFPLPTPSKSGDDDDAGSDSEASESEDVTPAGADTTPATTTTDAPPQSSSSASPPTNTSAIAASRRPKRDKDSYTLLLTLARDRAPKIIAREDGFEKRHIWRCGRCKLVVGYQLDEVHYELGPKSDTHGKGTVIVGGGDAGTGKDRVRKEKERMAKEGRRWFYVLPGAVTVTEELGREPRREEVELVKAEG